MLRVVMTPPWLVFLMRQVTCATRSASGPCGPARAPVVWWVRTIDLKIKRTKIVYSDFSLISFAIL